MWPGTGRCSMTSEKKIASKRRSVGASSRARSHSNASVHRRPQSREATVAYVGDAAAIRP